MLERICKQPVNERPVVLVCKNKARDGAARWGPGGAERGGNGLVGIDGYSRVLEGRDGQII